MTKLAGHSNIAGVALNLESALPAGPTRSCTHFFTPEAVPLPNPFNKPWNEIVADDFPYFPGGALVVKLTIKRAAQA